MMPNCAEGCDPPKDVSSLGNYYSLKLLFGVQEPNYEGLDDYFQGLWKKTEPIHELDSDDSTNSTTGNIASLNPFIRQNINRSVRKDLIGSCDPIKVVI